MRRFFIFLFFVILLVSVCFGFYFFSQQSKKSQSIVLYGNVDVRQVDLGFRVNGRITAMSFEEGDLVLPGGLVATLDRQPYIDQVLQAAASLESVETNLAYAEKVLNRRQSLRTVADGTVSLEDFENALASRDALASNLKEAQAKLGVTLTNLRETKVFAPSEGVVLTRIREPGSVVKEGDPIYTISITSPVWVRAFIPEPLLGTVYPGMPAEVFTDTKNGVAYKGHVGFISPVAEFTPKTVETTELRTDLVFRLRVIVDNPDKGLRQGMPVTVVLPIDHHG